MSTATATITTDDDGTTLTLGGDLSDCAGILVQVKAVAAKIVGREGPVAVDVTDVDVMGLAGFQVIAGLNNAVPSFGSDFWFVARRGPVGNLLRLLRGPCNVRFV